MSAERKVTVHGRYPRQVNSGALAACVAGAGGKLACGIGHSTCRLLLIVRPLKLADRRVGDGTRRKQPRGRTGPNDYRRATDSRGGEVGNGG